MNIDAHSTPAVRDSRIRVCFVIDRLCRAGTESQLLLLLSQLDRQRIEPFLCLLDGHDDESRALLPADCPAMQLGVRRLRSMNALRQAWRFYRFLRRERIDVVQTFFLDSTRFAAPIAKAAGVRAVFGSRRNSGYWMNKSHARIARFYNRFFIDKILANCNAARESVITQEGVRPEKVIVLRNGIDLERFAGVPQWRPKSVGQRRKVGMVGNLRPVKGPDLLIRAAKLVVETHPDVEFEIAGGGDPGPYSQLIGELGVSKVVRLLGTVSDVPAFLATVDIAVLPSRAEGLPNALLEYMAAGRPIIATDVGENADILGDLAGRCCIPSGDYRLLADRISRFLDDDELAQSLARSAQAQLATQLQAVTFDQICESVCV